MAVIRSNVSKRLGLQDDGSILAKKPYLTTYTPYTMQPALPNKQGISTAYSESVPNTNTSNSIISHNTGYYKSSRGNRSKSNDFGNGLPQKSYTMGDEVKNYQGQLKALENKPIDPYQSKYTPQINSILDGIMNRKSFDLKSDNNYKALYDTMRENYMNQGQKAMRDTIASASALSGGYGNSYAQTVGSQAYDNYLHNLNAKNMELMNLAYGMYSDDRANDYNKLQALTGLDNTDYARYRDTVGDYMNDRDYLAGRYNTEYGNDYRKFADDREQANNERNFAYQQSQDRLAQENLMRQFAYQKLLDDRNQRNNERDFAYGQQKDRLAQDNYLKDFNYKQAQDKLAQENYLKDFDYKKSQDELAQRNYEDEKAYKRQQDALALSMARSGGSGGRGSGGGRRRGRSGSGTTEKKETSNYNNRGTGHGYLPLTTKIYSDLKKGKITHGEGLSQLQDAYTQGLINENTYEKALKSSGINETKAFAELTPRLEFNPIRNKLYEKLKK